MGHGLPRPGIVRALFAVLLLAVGLSACADAQTKSSALEVRRLWEEYLSSKRGKFVENAGTPSPLWNAAEQAQWPMYDLAGFYLPDGAIPEVASVMPVNAAVDSAYRIVTRFWPAGSTVRDSSAAPVLTMRVYARRQGTRWLLSNALAYETHTWYTATRGRITYRVAPALRFNAERAERAAAFVDSLATVFGVSAPERIDYYVAESVDQAMEILGVVVPQKYGAAGGFAKPVNAQVFSGIPALGENYRHELAHVVFMPIVKGSSTTLLASEGVPAWFGGTAGRTFEESVQRLDSALTAQPQLTLNAIVFDPNTSSEIRNTAGAVLAQMIHDAGGVAALREYLQSSQGAIRLLLERRLGRSWAEIGAAWRRRVQEIAATGS